MLDYTIIVHVRHQFGGKDLDIGVFAGEEKDFSFDCPNVDASQNAVLLFQGSRVGEQQTLEINGSTVSGGIPPSPTVAGLTSFEGAGLETHAHTFLGSILMGWSAFVMLVGANTLRDTKNVMRVVSTSKDEFLIDNVVLFYKQTKLIPEILT